jgi:AhpD family alkylhydroperoxidase
MMVEKPCVNAKGREIVTCRPSSWLRTAPPTRGFGLSSTTSARPRKPTASRTSGALWPPIPSIELCWARAKAIMRPGKLDLKTKEIIALAVSITNSCRYCINSHTTALQKLGLDAESYGELLAVVGLYNQFNKLTDGLQVEPDVIPDPAWPTIAAK